MKSKIFESELLISLRARLQALNKRERVLLGIAAAGFVLFSIVRCIWLPLKEFREKLDQEIALAETQWVKHLQLLQEKKWIEETSKTFQESLTVPMTDAEATAALLHEIGALTGQAKMKFSDLQPFPVQESNRSGVRIYSVRMNAQSSLPNLLDFLYQLRNSRLALRVEEIRLENAPQKADWIRSTLVVSFPKTN